MITNILLLTLPPSCSLIWWLNDGPTPFTFFTSAGNSSAHCWWGSSAAAMAAITCGIVDGRLKLNCRLNRLQKRTFIKDIELISPFQIRPIKSFRIRPLIRLLKSIHSRKILRYISEIVYIKKGFKKKTYFCSEPRAAKALFFISILSAWPICSQFVWWLCCTFHVFFLLS